tara:strand:- start:28061 stop:29011 length:951 start_codon:yes stop_codon:yes gene_type:complete
MMSYKSKQFLWLVLKLLIVIVCGYFIYERIAYNQKINFNDFYSILINFDVFSLKNIVFLLFFSLLNWFLEITKWRVLARKVQKTSWIEAAKQSLSSLTFSLVTPNRIGEYGAKALYYSKNQRKEIFALNFIGNFYQLIITLLTGSIGFVFLFTNFSKHIPKKNTTVLIFSFILSLILLIISFNKIPFLINYTSKTAKYLRSIKKRTHQLVLSISLWRYIIFSHQFYFLTLIFDVDISYINTMACISSMYLISSIIPMLSLFDFVIKGSVALIVFGFFDVSPIIIVSISTLMWILNFAFAAIIGSYFVLTFRPKTAV